MLASTSVSVRPFTALAPRPVRAVQRCSVVVAVKPTKAGDFRGLSDEEVVTKIGELKVELAATRFLQRTKGNAEMKPGEQMQPNPEKVPKAHTNKHLRRQVAQLWTILRERQLAQGISARDARKIETRAALAAGL